MKKLKTALLSVFAAVIAVSSMLLTACGQSGAEEVLEAITNGSLQSFSGKLDFEFDTIALDGYMWTGKDYYGTDNASNREKVEFESGDLMYASYPNMNLTVKGNYPDGNLDLFIKMNERNEEKDFYYWFFRGWEGYGVYSSEEITELNGLKTYPMGDSQIFKMGIPTETVDYATRVVNYFIINLAGNFGGLTVSGDKITADLNKTAFNLLNSLKGVIDNLKPSTTLGDLLTDNTVRAVISSAVNGLKPEEAVSYILKYLELTPLMENEICKGLIELLDEIKPDANSSTFDYIVKYFSSDKTYNFINEMCKKHYDIALPAKLDKLTLDFIFDTTNAYENLNYLFERLFGVKNVFNPDGTVTVERDWEEIKDFDSLKKGVKFAINKFLGETTATLICLHLPDRWSDWDEECVWTVSDAKVEYSISGGKIASQTVSANLMKTEFAFSRYMDTTEEIFIFMEGKQTVKYRVKGELTYGDSKPALTDIVIEE